MTATTLKTRPTPTGVDLRDELLIDGDWMVIDAALLADLRAWMDGRLEWSPALVDRSVPRADHIEVVLDGVRAGHLVPVYRGDVVYYGDVLALESARAAAAVLESFAEATGIEAGVRMTEASADFWGLDLVRVRPVNGAVPLERALVAALLAQLSLSEHWAEQLVQSRDKLPALA